jgi:hypothetical protein
MFENFRADMEFYKIGPWSVRPNGKLPDDPLVRVRDRQLELGAVALPDPVLLDFDNVAPIAEKRVNVTIRRFWPLFLQTHVLIIFCV